MITIDCEERGVVRKRNVYALSIAFIASVGGFLFGYDLSLVRSAGIYLRPQFHLSDQAFGFLMVSAAYGCILGPFLGSWL